MPDALPDVRPIEIAEVEAARTRIAGTIVRTPLLRVAGPAGTANLSSSWRTSSRSTRSSCAARPTRSQCSIRAARADGVWTISAGNAGQGVAYAARKAGVPCTVVAIETAPETKVERMRALGATS